MTKPKDSSKASAKETTFVSEQNRTLLESICRRVHYLTTQMIWQANTRPDHAKGDPKIGGHPAACASALHIMGALHLIAKSGFDYIANKPHAAPVDHSFNYVMDLLFKDENERLSPADGDLAMMGLRKFSQNGEPVFQSYHSVYDSDHQGFLPSGTVGIPQVNLGYIAHAFRFAKNHGYQVPEAHFWAVMGDSEFREGSVFEAVPDFAERELGNLTWIVDYNRQSLDGHRISNKKMMSGNDNMRIERTMAANGWDVVQIRHGHKRSELFARKNGNLFKKFIEEDLEDYELQALLLVKEPKDLKKDILSSHPHMQPFLAQVTDSEIFEGLRDFGGHDILAIAEALLRSKENPRKPTIIIVHTLKGWGLRSAASQGNHSSLPDEDEVEELRLKQKLPDGVLFARFDESSNEGKFCKKRGNEIFSDFSKLYEMRENNRQEFADRFTKYGEIPTALGINLKMASFPHTQWMLGQCTAKLTRIANSPVESSDPKKALPASELPWKTPAELMVSMAPDVGTSTNLNPTMDGKIFGSPVVNDFESEFGVKDQKAPDLVPGEEVSDRFIRFEIAESNVMSCVGSYGRIRDILGIPLMPLMTVYDFFIKRAHDQLFYNLYWKSSFILVGTPSGITLSPEGAQHGWKSDFQIPNQITWEPMFCIELDWILSDSVRRHMLYDNEGRTGVVIRGVTRGIDQKLFFNNLKRQKRFKAGFENLGPLHVKDFPLPGAANEAELPSLSDDDILSSIHSDVLNGAYYLIDYRGYAGYEPGDNVVNIFTMGAVGTEAIAASDELLKYGVYANVIVVTSSDLLVGIQAHTNDYKLLKRDLGITGNVFLRPETNNQPSFGELMTYAGRRIPIVSVHDGEAGLLDNLGSVVGVRHESLAIRKHSKCGRPDDIYKYHHLDSVSIIEAVGKVLSDTALEEVQLSENLTKQLDTSGQIANGSHDWRSLWPNRFRESQGVSLGSSPSGTKH